VTVKLRLMRMGKKKQPTYRIVVADSRSPRDGRFIETVGTYAPRLEPSGIQVDNERALGWLAKGAQPTDTVRKLLVISGAWEQFETAKPPKKASTRPERSTAGESSIPAAKTTAKKAAVKKVAAATEPTTSGSEDDEHESSAEEAGDE